MITIREYFPKRWPLSPLNFDKSGQYRVICRETDCSPMGGVCRGVMQYSKRRKMYTCVECGNTRKAWLT